MELIELYKRTGERFIFVASSIKGLLFHTPFGGHSEEAMIFTDVGTFTIDLESGKRVEEYLRSFGRVTLPRKDKE